MRALLSALLLLSLAGCSTVTEPLVESLTAKDPTLLELEVEAGYNINPNRNGDGAPVVLRIYELSDAAPFSQARFIDLYQQGDDLLQGSLVKRHQLPAFLPGRRTRLSYALADSTRYIAVLAEFASYETAQTKAVAPIGLNTTNQGVLTIEGLNLHLSIPQPAGVLDGVFEPAADDVAPLGEQLSRDNE